MSVLTYEAIENAQPASAELPSQHFGKRLEQAGKVVVATAFVTEALDIALGNPRPNVLIASFIAMVAGSGATLTGMVLQNVSSEEAKR